jgi:hypothetical protein
MQVKINKNIAAQAEAGPGAPVCLNLSLRPYIAPKGIFPKSLKVLRV